MIERSHQQIRSQVIEFRRHLMSAMADEQKLYQRCSDARRESARWSQRAELALSKGLEGLAREALARSREYDLRAADFERQYLEQKAYVERMKTRLKALESGVGELPAAGVRSLESQRIERALAQWERQEERARDQQARLAAQAELERDDLAERLAALERDDLLDRQLAELKEKLGAGRRGDETE